MKISTENPPYGVREKCEEKFDLSNSFPIFTFKDVIYNPLEGEIDDALIAHESTHTMQQGDDPYAWWDRYLSDPEFRYQQELQAYRVQYRVATQLVKDRNKLARMLVRMSADLASDMYGGLVTQSEAYKAIKKGV